MRVALLTVGDELLAGDTVNTNAAWLGRQLTEQGVDVERVTVVPDRTADIARHVNEYRAEFDAVVVTGGLGPTHDDLTMAGVAAAFGRELEASDEVEAWLTEGRGYSNDDIAPGTTEIPRGARMLENPEGVAPGCVIGSVYVLPGVPREMKAMFELVAEDFVGDPPVVAVVETAEPESQLLGRVAALREQFDVGVGSYPGESVRIKIYGTDGDAVEEAAAWLRERVEPPDAVE